MKTLADRAQAYLANPWQAIPGARPRDHGLRTIVENNFRKRRSQLRAARRFTLDDAFVRESVQVASVQPSVILARAQLANMPYDNIWIEFDQEVRVQMQVALKTSADLSDTSDRGLGGFLLTRASPTEPSFWTAYGFFSGRDEGSSAFMHFCCHQFGGMGHNHEANKIISGANDASLRIAFTLGWGYAPNHEGYTALLPDLMDVGCTLPDDTLTWPTIAANTDSFRMNDVGARAFDAFTTTAIETRGDMRWLITVLAMINHVPVRYTHRPATGRFTRRLNTMDYLDSHVVTIEAGRTKTVNILDRAAKHAEQSRRRAHEVRGHWMIAEHGNGRPGCSHLPISGDGKHALCGKCGAKIVWREHHQRGDASLGFVKKEYEVTV